MPSNVTRYIKRTEERELWARAAGRCQFDGCNRLLYKSPITQESVNISEKAHIWSFSENGPRGWGPFKTNLESINSVSNLMLMCHDCHKKIDKEKNGGRYPAKLLVQWKKSHEKRVSIVSGVKQDKRSHVVLYGANIDSDLSPLQTQAAMEAVFPDRYPSSEHPIQLGMKWSSGEKDESFWTVEQENLIKTFETKVEGKTEDANNLHFSVFGLAPMPLLIQLGALLTDKLDVTTHQLQREPEKTWRWSKKAPEKVIFSIAAPTDTEKQPALILSLSAKVSSNRISDSSSKSFWEIEIDSPNNDFLKSKKQLSDFRKIVRKVIAEINAITEATHIEIYPAIPVACAIELGRTRMPKVDLPLIIYDSISPDKTFTKALTIK